MNRILRYINPIQRLGEGHYSILFPFITNIFIILASEIYAYGIARDPMAVGSYIIFLDVLALIYFAFRDGIRGGLITTFSSVFYYFYIIYSRNYTGQQLDSGVTTTLVLGTSYLFLGFTIGWLKQRIDFLIEKQKDERRRLETIIQQLPVGVLITDQNGRLVQRNRQLDNILGVKLPVGFHIGIDTLEQEKIDNKSINPSQSPLARALKTKKAVLGKEYIFQRKDGKKIFLQVNSTPIVNSRKKVIAAATIVNDITRRKQLERQKDDFLGIASHELKTPVTSIKAYAQVLKMQFQKRGEKDAVEKLQKLDTQINKLTSLISDLLDVTKMQSGRLEYHPSPFDFNELVEEVVEELKFSLSQHSIITKLGKEVYLTADRERVGQVLVNLITNAIKYSPKAKKIIISTISRRDSIMLSVKDFGVGIPKEKQKKVFKQFFRVSGAKQNTFPGLGLGLYISSEIIKRQGGKIWVESSEGKGSVFSFSLPKNAPSTSS